MAHRWGNRSRHERGYGTAWDRLRLRILKRDQYLCRACSREGRVAAATSVDHIIPKAKGGGDDPGNLESLCAAHRAAKDRADRGARPKPAIGLDGWPV